MANEGIAFSRNLIDRFIQFKQLQRAEQREDERNRRFDLSLQQNRRTSQEQFAQRERQFTAGQAFAREGRRIQEGQFATRERRLTSAAESLIEQRGRPERGTKEHFESLGYPSETAQQLQDQVSGLISKPLSPQQMVVIGQAMMNNPLSTEMFNSGRTLLKKGLTVIQGQNPAFPSRPQGGGANETIKFETTGPTGSGVFRPRTPDTGDAILGGRATQDFLPPNPDEGLFDRVNEGPAREELLAEYRRLGGSSSPEARKFAEDNGLID